MQANRSLPNTSKYYLKVALKPKTSNEEAIILLQKVAEIYGCVLSENPKEKYYNLLKAVFFISSFEKYNKLLPIVLLDKYDKIKAIFNLNIGK